MFQSKTKQECISVGCVPSAAVAVCPGGGVSPGGVSAQGGLPGGVSAQGECLPRGVSAQGGCLPREGVSAWGLFAQGLSAQQRGVSQYALVRVI